MRSFAQTPGATREPKAGETRLSGRRSRGEAGEIGSVLHRAPDDERTEAEPKAVGLPGSLRRGLERLSGADLSQVRVHHDSPRPARLDALAYTRGPDIHVAPGQERYLAHEGWHAVQQMQGRVRPTSRLRGMSMNDDPHLEREADSVSARLSADWRVDDGLGPISVAPRSPSTAPVQRLVRLRGGASKVDEAKYKPKGPKAKVGAKRKVADLIADPVKRAFKDEAELDEFAEERPTTSAMSSRLPPGRFGTACRRMI